MILNQNMMLVIMMQQATNQGLQNNNTNIKGDSSSLSTLNELKELVNKYKNMMSTEYKNRMDFLIDRLSKKM